MRACIRLTQAEALEHKVSVICKLLLGQVVAVVLVPEVRSTIGDASAVTIGGKNQRLFGHVPLSHDVIDDVRMVNEGCVNG